MEKGAARPQGSRIGAGTACPGPGSARGERAWSRPHQMLSDLSGALPRDRWPGPHTCNPAARRGFAVGFKPRVGAPAALRGAQPNGGGRPTPVASRQHLVCRSARCAVSLQAGEPPDALVFAQRIQEPSVPSRRHMRTSQPPPHAARRRPYCEHTAAAPGYACMKASDLLLMKNCAVVSMHVACAHALAWAGSLHVPCTDSRPPLPRLAHMVRKVEREAIISPSGHPSPSISSCARTHALGGGRRQPQRSAPSRAASHSTRGAASRVVVWQPPSAPPSTAYTWSHSQIVAAS